MGEYEDAWRYLERLPDELKKCARMAVKTVTEEKAKAVKEYLESHTPVIDRWQPTADRGNFKPFLLERSLKIKPVNTVSRSDAEVIGYEVVYDGYYTYAPRRTKRQGQRKERQVAYQKIANSLNAGFIIQSNIPNWNAKYVTNCRGFLDKALVYLVNMDEEISKKFAEYADKIS